MYTKESFIKSLENEVRIIKHLATKIPEGTLDYRPTPGQRSTIELLKYLSAAGSGMMKAVLHNDTKVLADFEEFRNSVTLENFGEKMDIQEKEMKEMFAQFKEEDYGKEVDFYGKALVSEHMINILRTFSAYRMQLFLYIKANGVQLGTMNVWAGMDANQ